VSVRVQALPSLQAVPLVAFVCVHCASTHASTVHGLPSSQLAAEPQANPVWKVRRESTSRITSCAVMAPDASKRAPARKLPVATANAVILPSTPNAIESPVPATTSRRSFAPSGALGKMNARSPATILPVTLTVDGASATMSAPAIMVRLWNS
jgi:hypothetical protein